MGQGAELEELPSHSPSLPPPGGAPPRLTSPSCFLRPPAPYLPRTLPDSLFPPAATACAFDGSSGLWGFQSQFPPACDGHRRREECARPGRALPLPAHSITSSAGESQTSAGPCHLGRAGEWPGSPPGPQKEAVGPTTGQHELLLMQPAVGLPGRAALAPTPAPSGPASPQLAILISKMQSEQATRCPEPSLAPQYPQDQAVAQRPGPLVPLPLSLCHAAPLPGLHPDSPAQGTPTLQGTSTCLPPGLPTGSTPTRGQAPWILPTPRTASPKAQRPSGHWPATRRTPADN